jgi:shikimate dehydrogenase
MMKKLGVIGSKIGYSMSPTIHQWIGRRYNIDLSYDIFDVKESDLPAFIQGLKDGRYHGFNVTKPYKETMMRWVDQLTPVAAKVHAVNTLYLRDGLVIGDNTDVAGFEALLASSGVKLVGQEVVVLGSGGAAKAVVHVFEKMGIKPLVAARHTEQASTMFERVVSLEHLAPLAGALVIHSTPVGTFPDVLASVVDEAVVRDAYVIDLVYRPMRTKIVKDAKDGIGGALMLLVQALKSAEQFHQQSFSFEPSMFELFGGHME